jgi:hypothetical protein
MDTRPWTRPTYQRTAVLSPCGLYRYTLERWWNAERPGNLVVIGLNPSTADALQDDPTIRRCVDFADQMGFGGLVMLNAYGYRATDPKALADVADFTGHENDRYLAATLAGVPWAVCAWSDHVAAVRRDEILSIFREVDCKPRVFGLTKNGAPRHPLYLPRTARPVPWSL